MKQETIHPLQEQFDMVYLILEFIGLTPRDAVDYSLVCKDWTNVIRKLPIELNLLYVDIPKISQYFDDLLLFERVEKLSLHGSYQDSILKILNSSAVSNMKIFKLVDCTKQLALEISKRNNLKHLTELRIIDSDNISNEGGIALVQCENFKNLKVLQFDFHNLGVQFAIALSESPYMSNLEQLHLNFNDLGDESMKYLSNSSILSKIICLRLQRNNISHVGASYLSNSKMSDLKLLNLKANHLKDEGTFFISQIETLQTLQLDGNGITLEGIKHLAKSPFLTNLTSLCLGNVTIFNANDCKRQNFTNSYEIEAVQIITESLRNLNGLELIAWYGYNFFLNTVCVCHCRKRFIFDKMKEGETISL